jgi:streptogramin lyase
VGVVTFDGAGFTRYTTKDGLPGGGVFQVAVAADGTIWAATERSGVARFDGNTWTTYTTDHGLLSYEAVVAAGTDGTVWAVHPVNGYSRFDGTGWTPHPFDPPVGDFRAAVTSDGMLWTISDEGLIGFDGNTRTIHPSPFVQLDGSLKLTPVQWGSASIIPTGMRVYTPFP